MERLFRFLINYKIKYLIPVLLSVGVIITSVGILFTIYFFVSSAIERQISNGMQYHRNIILYLLDKNPQILKKHPYDTTDIINDELLFYSNNLYQIFLLNKIDHKVLMSNYSIFIYKDFNEILKQYKKISPFEWKDILNAKSYVQQHNKKSIYNFRNNYFYVEEFNKDYLLIIYYNFNWFDLFNYKNFLLLLLVFILLIFLPFLFFFYFYKKFYETRIDSLLNGIEKISDGELTTIIPIIGNDEISKISSFVNEMKEQLKDIIYKDSLTDILNRKGFEYFCNKYFNPKKEYAMFFMDLDGFKYINETYGHDVGDKALQVASYRLKKICESNLINTKIILGRIGGDEFAIFIDLSNLKEPYVDLQKFAFKIIEEISQKIEVQNLSFNIGISIGISIYPKNGSNLNELITHADLAMYQVKYSTKNSYYFFDNRIKSQYEQKNLLRNELIKIFRNNQLEDHFYLVFQPIYNLKLKKINHLEVLLRFQHESIQASPNLIIPILEELNFITEMGNFVIGRSLNDFIQIKNMIEDELKLCINISTKQILDKNFYKYIVSIYKDFSKYNIKNDQIIFEITESTFINDPLRAIRIINSLNDMGFEFAIDDFGTGYSSLSYLKTLPIKYIKIDKSFSEDIAINPKTEVVVRSIISLAHSLNLFTIVEGVEDILTIRKIKELNGDYVQGFILTNPLIKEELIDFIKEPKEYLID